MDRLAPALCVLAGVAGVSLLVVAIVVAVMRERDRQRRIRHWAARHGWQVAVHPAVDWAAQLPGGRRGRVYLLVSAMVGGRYVGVADYAYTTESSNSDGSSSRTTHRFIVTAVRLDARYPPVAVQPRGALSRFGRSLFGDNAAATGHDAFDRQFRVRTKEPGLARALLSPTLIHEHLAGRVPAWSLAGQDLLTWRSGAISDPNQIPGMTAGLIRVADLLGR